jgi:D-alanyl-lipoteichoic acid acyltransferase DltB (MBOAT superfamily)
MLFNSYIYIFCFLPIVLLLYFSVARLKNCNLSSYILVFASLFFYSYWNIIYLPLILFSIIFNYIVGSYLTSEKEIRYLRHKAVFIVAVVANLGLLGFFKYFDFFVDTINQVCRLNLGLLNIALPLAISFFTFQQLAYVTDSYRKETKGYHFIDYCKFVTFFPQLIAGPIVYHKEVMGQFADVKNHVFNFSKFNQGVAVFSIGLLKKVILADSIARYATPVFQTADSGTSVSFFEAWGGALAYTTQLYFDFSGYSDMAIGAALMFGIVITENFNSPYKSLNIIDFWRRWHITLSRFIKSYVYIPLGGNRRGSMHLNLLIAMLLGGLWHGAGWNFVLWGLLHGVCLIINHTWRHFRKKVLGHDLSKTNIIGRVCSIGLTFFTVVLGWVFFRAETYTGVKQMFHGMFNFNDMVLASRTSKFLPEFTHRFITFQESTRNIGMVAYVWIIGLLFLIFFMPNTAQLVSFFKSSYEPMDAASKSFSSRLMKYALPIYVGILFFICVKAIGYTPDSEFLYFDF